MEIKGKVIKIEEPITGQSQKGEWKKQEFVIETLDQYPKKIAFVVWNDKVKIPTIGTVANVHFNAESNEYSGRFYTNLTMWRCEVEGVAEQQSVSAPEATQEEIQEPAQEDGLPF